MLTKKGTHQNYVSKHDLYLFVYLMDDLISESHVALIGQLVESGGICSWKFASFSFQERFSGMSLKSFGM